MAAFMASPIILGYAFPAGKYPWNCGWFQWVTPGMMIFSRSSKIRSKLSGFTGAFSGQRRWDGDWTIRFELGPNSDILLFEFNAHFLRSLAINFGTQTQNIFRLSTRYSRLQTTEMMSSEHSCPLISSQIMSWWLDEVGLIFQNALIHTLGYSLDHHSNVCTTVTELIHFSFLITWKSLNQISRFHLANHWHVWEILPVIGNELNGFLSVLEKLVGIHFEGDFTL